MWPSMHILTMTKIIPFRRCNLELRSMSPNQLGALIHDDVIKWKNFPRYWPFVWGIHKGQWRGALMFSLICAWINGYVNNREAGDLRRHRAHYDVTVMHYQCVCTKLENNPSCCNLSYRAHTIHITGGFDISIHPPMFRTRGIKCNEIISIVSYNISELCNSWTSSQIAKLMGPTWGPHGSCRPQMGPMLAPWNLLSRLLCPSEGHKRWCWKIYRAWRLIYCCRLFQSMLFSQQYISSRPLWNSIMSLIFMDAFW